MKKEKGLYDCCVCGESPNLHFRHIKSKLEEVNYFRWKYYICEVCEPHVLRNLALKQLEERQKEIIK